MSTEISVVLPAYNEAKRLPLTVEKTVAILAQISSDFEIIIAEDGSTDGTDMVAEQLAIRYGFIKHLHFNERQGRGRALNNAFEYSKGGILVYMDVDLATDMRHLRELIDYIRKDSYDVSTGSRMLPESDVKRPLKRRIASKGFNFMTRFFLKSELYDHQCGFKAFKKETFIKLRPMIKDTHWFWDTEILVRAQRGGYKVKEFPVHWKHGGMTKVDMVRDVFGMGSQILRLWFELLWK
jgi:glycosyltransferase AglD